MFPIPVLSGNGPVPSYASMTPAVVTVEKETAVNTRVINNYSQRLPDAPPLAINTDFRPSTLRPLPLVPPAYNYNYGFAASRPNVSSLTGAIPEYGTSLTKIGPGGYPILEPVNLYPNLKMRC